MLSLLCLGIGKGATNFFDGAPSTAYLLKRDGEPILLLDCGAGVGRSIQSFGLKELPRHIYISHNHNDHTGDLPVYMTVQHAQTAMPIEFYGHQSVLDMVAKFRLHELNYVGHEATKIARWNTCGDDQRLSVAGLELELFKTGHSYLCYGFFAVDAVSNGAVLGWSADGRFDQSIYDKISKAPVAIVHAREEPSKEHASFLDVEEHAKRNPNTFFYVAHHEGSDHVFSCSNVAFFKVGMEIVLQE